MNKKKFILTVLLATLLVILTISVLYFKSSKNIHLSGKLWFGKIRPMVTDGMGKMWGIIENPSKGITNELLQSYIDKNVEIDGKIITITEGVECKAGEVSLSQIGCKHDVKVVFPEKIKIFESEEPKQ